MDITISTEYDGKSVYDMLRRKLRVSSKLLARLKRDEDGILLNGQRVNVRCVLRSGDVLSVADFAEESASPITPVNIPVDIVYEDDCLLIANKPPFMPTHPSHDHYTDTLANALAYLHSGSDIPFVFRPVSRLDRNTSGLVTVAKTKYASARLNDSMKRGEFHKSYIAVLDGVPPEASGVIDACLHRTSQSIIVREVCQPDTPDAEHAVTEYEVLYTDGQHSIVRARPLTGRTHQIRVHFASLGAPVCGDGLYGTDSALISRHALHATALTLPHPVSEKSLSFSAPLPDDMLKLIEALFGNAVLTVLPEYSNAIPAERKEH